MKFFKGTGVHDIDMSDVNSNLGKLNYFVIGFETPSSVCKINGLVLPRISSLSLSLSFLVAVFFSTKLALTSNLIFCTLSSFYSEAFILTSNISPASTLNG